MTFSHETCTFCPGGDVDIADWTRSRSPYLGDEVLSVGGYVRGFVMATYCQRSSDGSAVACGEMAKR